MRLVVATPLYPPEIGGPATYAHILAQGLPKHGIEVEVVKFSGVRHLPKIIRHYVYYRRVLKAARKADIVLVLDPVSTGMPALQAAHRADKPLVVKIVGDYAWEQGRQRYGITATLDEFVITREVPVQVRALRALQTRVALGASRIIVPSRYLRGIIEAWGIMRSQIEVIHNAVPAEEPGTVPEAVATLPRPLVVTAGRLVPWKGIGGVINAVALLRQGSAGQAASNASLAIVGDGPLHTELVREAEEKLAGRYVFTGSLAHPDALAVIKSADAFVLNSTYEGLSHLLIEAASLGAPIVVTNVGGNPEVIADEESGLLVPGGDAAALGSALTRVLNDKELAARLSGGAKQSASHFSEEEMLVSTAELLHSLV